MKFLLSFALAIGLLGWPRAEAVSFDFYAPQPAIAAVDGKAILLTARLTIDLGAEESQVPAGVPLRGLISAETNHLNVLTGRYRIHRLYADDANPRVVKIFAPGTEPTFVPDGTVVARGYTINERREVVSWYHFRTGIEFRNVIDAQAFTIASFLESPSRNGFLVGTGNAAQRVIDFGVDAIADRNIAELALVAGYAGAYVVVYDPTGEGRVFRESQLVYSNITHIDPVFQHGGLIEVRTPGVLLNNQVHLVYSRGQGVEMPCTAIWNDGAPLTSLPPEYHAVLVGIIGGSTNPIAFATDAPDRTAPAASLFEAADAARNAPTAADQAQVAGVEVGLQESGAFSMENGVLMPVQGATGNAVLDAEREAFPSPEEMLIRIQAERNTQLHQLTPEVTSAGDAQGVGPANPDAVNLQAAIIAVEREMQREQPMTQPLRLAQGYRKSTMLAAGIKPYYLEGNPNPGDGDNPPDPRPAIATPTGAPAYDLDGDGDLDRYHTSDPFPGSMVWLRIKWSIREDDFRLGDYDSARCRFAVFGIDGKGKETLLLVGREVNIYRHRQHWTGRTYYKFGLSSLLDPMEVPGEYEFALAWTGNGVTGGGEITVPTPNVLDANGGTQQTMTMPNGATVTGPLVTWTETAEIYPQYVTEEYISPEDLAVATYSDPTFEPRTTDGKPYGGAKYTRIITTYTIQDYEFVAGEPVIETVFFPEYFRPEHLVDEVEVPTQVVPNKFKWAYPTKGTNGSNLPWNYHFDWQSNKRGYGVYLNEDRILNLWGVSDPALSVSGIAMSEGKEIRFRLREYPLAHPPLTPAMDAAGIAAATQQWAMGRSMYHVPRDSRTDLRNGRTIWNGTGDRIYEILEGLGYYIFKGKKRDYASVREQAELLRAMWEWSTWQPPTVFKVLHLDDDPSKPLLNTARATIGDGTTVGTGVQGALREEVSHGGNDMTRHTRRREDLINRKVMFFSAARGREWEIEYALNSPRETVLYCVEYESQGQVEALFSSHGRELHFIGSKDEEWRVINNCNERIFGRAHVVSRINRNPHYGSNDATNWVSGSPTAELIGDSRYLTKSRAEGFVFSDQDMIYDKPGCYLRNVALLADGQYGDPAANQWFADWKVEYRHPMIIFYDDRVSSVVVAYGENANPQRWVPLWDTYHTPVQGEALGYDHAQRERFEAWSSPERLAMLYDQMRGPVYEDAVRGNLVVPPPPAVVNEPQAPQAPSGYAGPSIEPIPEVLDPGPLPTAPEPIWTRTHAAWAADPAMAGAMGTARHPTTALRAWNETFPISDDLQEAHDAWIAQFDGVEWDRPGQWLQREGETVSYVAGNSELRFTWVHQEKTLVWGARLVRNAAYRNTLIDFTYASTNRERHHAFWRISGPRDFVRYAQTCPSSFGGRSGRITHPDTSNVVFGRSRTSGLELEPGLFRLDNYNVEIHHRHLRGLQRHEIRTRRRSGSAWQRVSLGDIFTIYPFDAGYIERVKAIAAADLLAYQAHLAQVERWPLLVANYENYQIAIAGQTEALEQYQAWLVQHEAAMQAYQQAQIVYQQRVTAYQQYVTARAEWEASNAELLALRAVWDAYVSGRNAWVYLVGVEIAEPGVAWHIGDPIFSAFEQWVMLYDF